MNNTLMSFILTILAGTSTMIGMVVIFIKKKDYNKIIASSLAFASGVMITISITDLVPESINLLRDNLNNINVLIISFLGIILGVIVSMLIDYYLPDNNISKSDNTKLYKVGLISMLAIIIHNIPEGIATFVATNSDIRLGLTLASAIAMHNIPEGISISVPIYYSTKSKKKAFLYTSISALSEPFGAVIAYLFLRNIMNDMILGILFSIIAGIMLQIAFCELTPESRRYNYPLRRRVYFIIGVIFMLLKFFL